MRRAHFLFPLGIAAVLAASSLVRAQASNGQVPSSTGAAWTAGALDPSIPSLPLRHPPLPPSGAIATELDDWREANAAVAEFPRGHMDILRWEAEQAGKAASSSGHNAHRQGGKP